MVQQSANIGVVKRLGRGGVAIGLRDLRIIHEGFHQRLQMGVLKGLQNPPSVCQSSPIFLVVFGKIVGKVDFRIAQPAQLVDRELEAVFVFVNQPFDLEKVVLLEGVDEFLDVVPHLGFDLAAAIAQSQRQIRLSGFLWFDLFETTTKLEVMILFS